MTREERILQLEKEIAELRDQDRIEKEKAAKEKEEKRKSDLKAIQDMVATYNKTYGGTLAVTVGKPLQSIDEFCRQLFPWIEEV